MQPAPVTLKLGRKDTRPVPLRACSGDNAHAVDPKGLSPDCRCKVQGREMPVAADETGIDSSHVESANHCAIIIYPICRDAAWGAEFLRYVQGAELER